VGKKKSDQTAGTPAIVALRRAGVAHQVLSYEHDARESHRTGFGREAAGALGLDPALVHKTLLADLDGRLVCAVVPVTGNLSLKGLAAALGGKKAVMADPAAAERSTGYVVGGISPLGQKRALPTVIDAGAEGAATIIVSAGARGLSVELSPTDLATLTKATFAPIAAKD
jgi:Cys-tRNA(Pro)/Cys-tRNA(Cys) deacylase